MSQVITRSLLENAMTYEGFKTEVERLYNQGQPTSGSPDDSALLAFTKLNLNRMGRNEKTNKVDPELASQIADFPKPMYWLVLVEGWCGDVAESVPVMHNLAKGFDHFRLGLIFRDQHLDVMDTFLTNGARAIPKLIIIDDEQLSVLTSWGPRPEPLQAFVDEQKQARYQYETKMDWVNSIHEGLHKWYAKDRGQTIQKELKQRMGTAQEHVVTV